MGFGALRYASLGLVQTIVVRYLFEANPKVSMPCQMISVKVKEGQKFCIHKEVLTEQSAYFEGALDGPFMEGQTNSISLDDIPAMHFGLYVTVMYASVLHRTDMTLQDVWPLYKGDEAHHPWRRILLLWQLADRFLNENVKSIAEEELHAKGLGYSVRNWQKMYERTSEASLKARMLRLQDAFRQCEEDGQPFQESFITAASNAPPQVFSACVDDLDDDFRSEVTKAFALRFADPASTAKKRRREERKEREHRGKKRKLEN